MVAFIVVRGMNTKHCMREWQNVVFLENYSGTAAPTKLPTSEYVIHTDEGLEAVTLAAQAAQTYRAEIFGGIVAE